MARREGERAGLGAGGRGRGRRQRAEAGRGAGGGRSSGLRDGGPRRPGSVGQVPRRGAAAQALRARLGPPGDAALLRRKLGSARAGRSGFSGESLLPLGAPRSLEAPRQRGRLTSSAPGRVAPGSPPAAGYATPTPTHATPAARSTRAQGRPPLGLSQPPTGEAGGWAAAEQARLASPRAPLAAPEKGGQPYPLPLGRPAGDCVVCVVDWLINNIPL
ncbi:collagen alpha-1(I) chain-like [Cervus elaphus]|uniref:collagen alpha-1(I) chain-like n=1 Tax=Cervus elaphus TaxID=9860 RepID=UPI001CC2CBC8|nr:collagen alpha-1(I) chain-like [Cervus elaphus]